MGYFIDLAQKYIDYDFDRSYPSPEEQLFWRLDDLYYKLDELKTSDAPYRGWARLSDDDIRFAIPEYFKVISDVERAIELAFADLKNDYDIEILEESDDTEMELNEVAEQQISLFDIISLPLLSKTIKAA